MGHVSDTFPFDVATVYAALTDADHLTRRCEAAKNRKIECTIDEQGGATVIRLSRDIESDIPSFAKKVVDPVNRVTVTFRWRDEGDGKKATYDVDINSRISLTGTITLRPEGERTRYDERYEAKVAIPLVGKKIAGLVEKETEKGIRGDIAFTTKYLRG